MDDGENNNSTKPIEFKPINVDYNISLAEAIKLSVEKNGYEAEIIKKDDATNVNIKIPYLVKNGGDMIKVHIDKNIYYASMSISVRRINTLEEKVELLEYINDKNSFVSFSWNNEDELSSIYLCRGSWRLDLFDKSIAWGQINIAFGNAQIDHNIELAKEKSALRERLSVYREENLEFNMSGKWNATHGYEYGYILNDINLLLRTVQGEKENLLRFT